MSANQPNSPADAGDAKPHQVITVRVPPSLHEHLKEIAWQNRVSMNRFCVDALEAAALNPPKDR